MDRLAIVMTFLAGSSIAGALVIAVLSLGWYSLAAIAAACGVGVVLAYPVGYVISRQIKRRDPGWRPRHKPGDFGRVPPADAPEV